MKRKLIVAIGLLIFTLTMASAHAQQANFPQDLVFSAAFAPTLKSPPRNNQLIWMDGHTLAMTPFYVDADPSVSGVEALSWSPDGQSLAIVKSLDIPITASNPVGTRYQLCILSRSGVLKRCMDAEPDAFEDDDAGNQLSTLSWSADSQHLYFATTRSNNSNQLIEADVNTGQTLRVVYELKVSDNGGFVPNLSWPRTLDYVATNVGGSQQDYPDTLKRSLVNLSSASVIDMFAAITAKVKPATICLQFSPQGTYWTALGAIGVPEATTIVIFDKQGNLVHTVDSTSGQGPLDFISCPTWTNDEQNIFFVASGLQNDHAVLYHYALSTKTLSIAFSLPATFDLRNTGSQGMLDGLSLTVSADGNFIAGNEDFNPNIGAGPQLEIVFPDGHYQDFLGPYWSTGYPVWVPNVPVAMSTDTTADTGT